jgi:hypothetical protein
MSARDRFATGFLLVVVAVASAAVAVASESNQSNYGQSPIPRPTVAESRHQHDGICRGGEPCEAAVLRESQARTLAKPTAGAPKGLFSRTDSPCDARGLGRLQTSQELHRVALRVRLHVLFCSWLT